ncbi:MAG: transposase [Candidatus Melainabacteria bacterium]|nr:transposase [Candidatus Melainabacteria bacterium]
MAPRFYEVSIHNVTCKEDRQWRIKKYSQEFKDGAIHLVLTGGKTSAALAKEIGLKGWQEQSWVRKAQGANAATTAGNQVDVAEFEHLKREHKSNLEENEILKCVQPCRTLSAGVLELGH